MTLVGVGHALADAFAFVGEDLPKMLGLHPGTFNRVPDYRMRAILGSLGNPPLSAGGSAANVVKLAARLGLDTHFVGQCGHDAPGQTFEAELLEAGVKVNLTKSDAPTGLCATLLTPPGRTVATFRAASGNLPLDLVGTTLIKAADVVVVEGYLLDEPDFLKELLGRCAQFGKLVALDTADGSLVVRHRETLESLLNAGRIAYLFLQEADAATLTGKNAEGSLEVLSQKAQVILRRQDRGWLVLAQDKIVAVPVSGASLDTGGTGDGFQAGFFWGLAQGLSPLEAARAGSLVAGCLAEQPGTRIEPGRWDKLVQDLGALG